MASALERVIDVAMRATVTNGGLITGRTARHEIALATRGIPGVVTGTTFPLLSKMDGEIPQPRIHADLSKSMLAEHCLHRGPAGWNWAATAPVRVPGWPDTISLYCGDQRKDRPRPNDSMERFVRYADIAADQLELIGRIPINSMLDTFEKANQEHKTKKSSSPQSLASVANFLEETLICQRRLLMRGDVAYHALMRWRSSIKDWQIKALRNLKKTRSPALIEWAACDMATEARRIFGHTTIQSVTNVPCGSSGPDCLARMLAERVALLIGKPYVETFATLPVQGTSHPVKNGKRPPMQLIARPTYPVLLIDDVATSGSHIAEAFKLLGDGPNTDIFPLVWLAA